jgi:ABC-type Fe3+ transport system substrate-binding protein
LFTETELTLTRDPRLLIDWLAQGKFHLALFVASDIDRAKEQGLPVESLDRPLKEGSSIGSGFGTVSYLNRAPHPHAARVFINWLLSREGQIAWQKNTGRNSLRTDISKDNIPREVIPTEEGNYFVRTMETNDVRPVFKLIDEALAQKGRK